MTIRVINFSDDIESSLVPADIPTSGQHTIENSDGTDFASRANLQFNEGFTVTDDMTNNRTIVNVNSNILRVGRLEVNVVNGSGADLDQYSAYSLEDNAYDLPTNTVTLTSTRTGIPTQGQTALFFCQEAIVDGTTGIGVIKGLVTTTVLSSVDSERDLKVLASGGLSDIILEGEYVVATVTRSPLLDTPLEIAFDGLSNYKFVVNTDTDTIVEIENNGTRIGDDSTTKLNFANNITATRDAADPTTVNITSEDVDNADNFITSLLERDTFQDEDGNLMTFDLEYKELDTKPNISENFTYKFTKNDVLVSNQDNVNTVNLVGNYNSINVDSEDHRIIDIETFNTITQFEDESIRLGTDDTFKVNFKGTGVQASLDSTDGSTIDVVIPGAVAGIEFENDGVQIPNSVSVTKLNFADNMVGVVDSNDDTRLNINSNANGIFYRNLSNTLTGTTSTTLIPFTDINAGSQEITDSIYSLSSNGTELTVLKNGLYRIDFEAEIGAGGVPSIPSILLDIYLRINGVQQANSLRNFRYENSASQPVNVSTTLTYMETLIENDIISMTIQSLHTAI